MEGCSCNHFKDPNAILSWVSAPAKGASLCMLVEFPFVMLNYRVHYITTCGQGMQFGIVIVINQYNANMPINDYRAMMHAR